MTARLRRWIAAGDAAAVLEEPWAVGLPAAAGRCAEPLQLRRAGDGAAPRAGLYNMGNTCFVGATVHALGAAAAAREAVAAAARRELPKPTAKVLDQLWRAMAAPGGADGGARYRSIVPLDLLRALWTAPRFAACRGGSQFDCDEFLPLLLQELDEVDFEVCAHGRPVAIRVSEAELERRFHRA